ncbi:MAG: glucose 1-dehydrogenase [Hellea sp.]|nr:glucose 1-dehydrogenase [Hellea sp.]
MTEFKDKVVIITGGSQNIGLAIAEKFLAAGATVVSADLKPPENKKIIFIKTDIASEGDVHVLMETVRDEFGRLDALINNAGICVEIPIKDMTISQWDRVMNINVRGVFLTTKFAFDLLKKSGSGAIVNISSIEALGANPLHSVYAASKGAVSSFTHNTALEYGPHGIRCNAIAPGWINTPFNEQLLTQYRDRDKVDAEIKALHPVGRLGQPQDIADVALFLAGPASAFISGQTIVADGGRLAKLPLPSMGG